MWVQGGKVGGQWQFDEVLQYLIFVPSKCQMERQKYTTGLKVLQILGATMPLTVIYIIFSVNTNYSQ